MAHILNNLNKDAILEKVYRHFYDAGNVIYESDNPLFDFEIEYSAELDGDTIEGTHGVIVCAYEGEISNRLLAFHVASNLDTDENIIIANVWVNKHGNVVVDATTSKEVLFGGFDCQEEYHAPSITEDPQGFISEYMKARATYILSQENYRVEPSDNPDFQLLISKGEEEHLVYVMCICTEYEGFDEIRTQAQRLSDTENACIFVNIIYGDDSSAFGLYMVSDLLNPSVDEPEPM